MASNISSARSVANADTTTSVDRAAIRVFNYFLVNECDLPVLTELEEAHVANDLVRGILNDYSIFLASHPIPRNADENLQTSSEDPKYLKYSTLVLYFSKAKTLLKDRFPSHELFADAMEVTWYPQLYKACETIVKRSQIIGDEEVGNEDCLPLYSFTHLCNPSLLHGPQFVHLDTVLSFHLCHANKNRTGRHMESRAALACTNHYCGRGGEVQFMSYKRSYFDFFYGGWMPKWTEQKTMKRYVQPTVAHKYVQGQLTFLACPLHSIASYCICEDGLLRDNSDKNPHAVFPKLHQMQNAKVTTYLTKVLRQGLPPSVASKYSAKSLRKGMITLLRWHRLLTKKQSNSRSGHDDGSNQEYYYDPNNPATTYPGGVAAAGWNNTEQIVKQPSLNCLGIHCAASLRNYRNHLFPVSSHLPEFHENGDLIPLLDQMLAVVILYYNDVRRAFPTNVLTYRMEDAARKSELKDTALGPLSPEHILQTWSTKLREDYLASNAVDELVPGNVKSESMSIVEKMTAQYKKLVELADGIAITNATISSFVDLGTRLRDLLSSFSLSPFSPRRQSATPNRQTPSKRLRQDDESFEESSGNDNMYDDDGENDDDNTSQRSPVPTSPPPRQAQPTATPYGMILQTQQTAAGTVTTSNPLKDADIGKLVSILYEKNLFKTSADRRSISDIWMPEMVSKNDSNKQYYKTVMNYVSFHISDEEYEELKKENLNRAAVQSLATKIDKRAKGNINKILDTQRTQTKLIGLGKKMREFCEKNKMTVAQVLQQKIESCDYFP